MTVRNVAGHCSSTQSSRNLETDAGFWRTKCLDGGTSRRRQVDAGGAPAEPAAAHDRRRNAYFRGAAVCQHCRIFHRCNGGSDRSARPIIRRAQRRWWAGAIRRSRARSRWRISACCFSTKLKFRVSAQCCSGNFLHIFQYLVEILSKQLVSNLLSRVVKRLITRRTLLGPHAGSDILSQRFVTMHQLQRKLLR